MARLVVQNMHPLVAHLCKCINLTLDHHAVNGKRDGHLRTQMLGGICYFTISRRSQVGLDPVAYLCRLSYCEFAADFRRSVGDLQRLVQGLDAAPPDDLQHPVRERADNRLGGPLRELPQSPLRVHPGHSLDELQLVGQPTAPVQRQRRHCERLDIRRCHAYILHLAAQSRLKCPLTDAQP